MNASNAIKPALAQPQRERRPQVLGLFLRASVTAVLVVLVTWRLDLRGLSTRVAELDVVWLAIAFALVFITVAVSAYKWGAILAWRGCGLPGRRLVRHYLVGLFFNNVLPTTVGGDVVRAWEASRDTGSVPEAFGSVIAERLIAGGALGLTTLLGLPFVDASPHLILLIAGFLVFDLVLLALMLVPRFAERIVTLTFPSRFAGLRGAAAATVAAVRETLRAPRLFAKVLVASILFQLLVAAVNLCIFEAMGVVVGLARCVVYTPMIFTVTMLPISLSGLGVREAAYWYFFAREGIGQADAVAASLCFFAIVAVASLPGAALFALRRRQDGAFHAEVAPS